jgi:hypothetical protein
MVKTWSLVRLRHQGVVTSLVIDHGRSTELMPGTSLLTGVRQTEYLDNYGRLRDKSP